MIDKLPILAIETSQSGCGACVYFDKEKFYEMCICQKYAHSEKVFEVVNSVIKVAGIKLSDLKVVAVSAGPGSFTGLRIGMSAAKGLACGASLPIVPVPTFEALAFQLSNQLDNGTEFIIANYVNSEEVYFAKFQVRANSYIFVQDLQIVKLTDNILNNVNCLVYGNASFNNFHVKNVIPISFPSPKYVAQWAYDNGQDKLISDFDFLEPNYLKNFIVKEK